MEALSALIFIGFIIWLWFDSLRCREIAIGVCRKFCQHLALQLLDDTVVLVRLRLKRDKLGRIRIQRTYHFEFHEISEQNRVQGEMILLGIQLEMIELPNYLERTLYQ